MPILKYTLLVGSSLLALLLVAEHVLAPAPTASPTASSSLEILRKMANHGEVRGFAPLADAGTFHLMPTAMAQPHLAAVEPTDVKAIEPTDVKPVTMARAAPPAVLDAQARAVEHVVTGKPTRPAKKVASRKPKQPRTQYVENVQHNPFGFFGGFQSW